MILLPDIFVQTGLHLLVVASKPKHYGTNKVGGQHCLARLQPYGGGRCRQPVGERSLIHIYAATYNRTPHTLAHERILYESATYLLAINVYVIGPLDTDTVNVHIQILLDAESHSLTEYETIRSL